MEDLQIVDLYWARSETAIACTARKYGAYCFTIAHNILNSREDADEVVNDTWMQAWNCMPTHRPGILSTFLGKITRRLSIDQWRRCHAQKRGGGEVLLSLSELEDCCAAAGGVEEQVELQELAEVINTLLARLPQMERDVFVSRYFFLFPIREIAEKFATTEGRIRTMLYRTRLKLRRELQKEGYE